MTVNFHYIVENAFIASISYLLLDYRQEPLCKYIHALSRNEIFSTVRTGLIAAHFLNKLFNQIIPQMDISQDFQPEKLKQRLDIPERH